MHAALTRRWRGGNTAFGAWVAATNGNIVRRLGALGFDYVGIDCQHGVFDETAAAEIAGTLVAAPFALLARVSQLDEAAIGRVLDAGADGVIVPMINTVEEAERAVAACRYQPRGVRSFGPRRHDLGRDPAEIEGRAGCFVMVETPEALSRVDEIARTPGLAGIYVGPVDLGVSLGVALADAHTSPLIMDAATQVRNACVSAGVVAGSHAMGPAHAAELARDGFTLVTVGTDEMTIVTGATRELAIARGEAVS